MHQHGETVTRLRGVSTTDPYSQTDTLINWDNPGTLEILGCVVYPAGTGETTTVGRTQVRESLTVLMPPESDVTDQDRLVIRGNTYDVDGVPHAWSNPISGRKPGIQVTAVRRMG